MFCISPRRFSQLAKIFGDRAQFFRFLPRGFGGFPQLLGAGVRLFSGHSRGFTADALALGTELRFLTGNTLFFGQRVPRGGRLLVLAERVTLASACWCPVTAWRFSSAFAIGKTKSPCENRHGLGLSGDLCLARCQYNGAAFY